jgi:hypothetical protein
VEQNEVSGEQKGVSAEQSGGSVEQYGVDPCVLLTGISRGGTTLACELLDRLPGVYALDEPMDPNDLVRDAMRAGSDELDAAAINAGIERFASEQRRAIIERGVVLTRHVDGKVLGAKVSDDRDGQGLRKRRATKSEIPVAPASGEDFTLIIKHPVAFTALLPILRERFAVFAIVRNPISILASWESVPFLQREGRLGLRESIAPQIARELAEIEDRLERQLTLLNWFYASYLTELPRAHVIRYEDVIATQGAALAPVVSAAAELAVPLQSRNLASVYDRAHMLDIGERLLAREGAWWTFYSRTEVSEVLSAVEG